MSSGKPSPEKIRQLLERWDVQLRPNSTLFRNPVTGVETACTPEQFAVIEATVKCWHATDPGEKDWCEKLAAANGFTLSGNTGIKPRKAKADHNSCRRWLNSEPIICDFQG